MLKVKLITHTPNAEQVVASAAKLCYSSVGVDEIMNNLTKENTKKFLDMLMSMGHESPLEHISFTFAIEGVSRSLTHQLVRHRIASYCLSGDTVVGYDNKTKGITIKELFNKPEQYKKMCKLRSVNEDNMEIVLNDVVNVIYSGEKELFEVITEDGYKIKATKKHRFFTNNGWKRLEEISIGDLVYTNGIDAYKSREWLYDKYIICNMSQEEIGELCGVSKHTIRSWIRKHNLQKEIGSWSVGKEPINKGKTKEDYKPLQIVSDKMKGNQNGKYTTHVLKDEISNSGGYSRVLRNFDYKGICSICREKGVTEVHHKDRNPQNDSQDNLIELCVTCHKRQHKGVSVKAVKPSLIISINPVGIEDTYDIEMKAPHHNFIADGFMVHNSQQSQRYVNLDGVFEYVTPNEISKNPEANNLYIKCMNDIYHDYIELTNILFTQYCYDYLVNENKLYSPDIQDPKRIMKATNKNKYNSLTKKAIENARYILPNACETKIVVTMNARSLINFFHHRCCKRAQDEIRELANAMLSECRKACPTIFKYAGARCVSEGSCGEGNMSCGLFATTKEVLQVAKDNGLKVNIK